ncbi:MAG: hypothetical protein II744_05345 [Eubacterium sp.]|nr:hypothetical protein [Eubacterium sp.]
MQNKTRTVLIVLSAVLVLLAAAIGFNLLRSGEMTVGKKISVEDITEFYYTEASSTNPPNYQRYRFYVDNGKYMFYREKREGNSFPLTEKDISSTDTKELSEQEWSAFCNCIIGGKVSKRTENTESGNSGPWTYLYWKGDRSKYQEYEFESPEKAAEFEEMCKELSE